LDKRKEAILRAITDDYIETAEPVGSRTIARKYRLGVSPATIRNEMADLEESGYLAQPHTSAGRIPSDKGYRFYVDVLMPQPDMTGDERQRLRAQVEAPVAAIEDMIRRATRLLAALTHYAAVAVTPSLLDNIIKAVQFVPIDENNVLIVAVIEPGFVQNRIMEAPGFDSEALSSAGYKITALLKGKALRNLTASMRASLSETLPYPTLINALFEMLSSGLANDVSEKVFLEGSVNLIDLPEFREIQKAKTLLSALQERERILDLLGKNGGGTSVAIGAENTAVSMQECSVVSATYRVNGHVVGTVGVIGPTRMDYTKGIALVETVAETLTDLLRGMSVYRK
jgi:heat-inducible transcriptional repressor